MARLNLTNDWVRAVALLESSTGNGILSFNTAAILVLIEDHSVSGKCSGSVYLSSAVAGEGGLSIDDDVTAAAAEHISIRKSKGLTDCKRRILNAASAVLRVNSLRVCLIQASALLGGIDREARHSRAVTDVNECSSGGIENLSAVASLKRHGWGSADGCLKVYN